MPPYVVGSVPDTFATVPDSVELREFEFRFSERISERPSAGVMDDAVVVSPSAGNLRVSHGRDGIRVRAQHALAPGRVYRITVLPVINDMFGNRLRDPFDLVVSTGGEFVPNVVAGFVEDRVTGTAVEGVRVQARFPDEEGVPVHWNYTSSEGVFSLRYVPSGAFEARAWQDRNRNDSLDDGEPRSEWRREALAAAPDTSFVVLSLIEPDTTGARLASVSAEDSVTLRFEFDDYLNPCTPGIVVSGFVRWEEAEGDTLSASLRIFQDHEHQRWTDYRADSIAHAAGTAEGDPPTPLTVGGCTNAQYPDEPVGLSGRLLPSQSLVGVLEESFLRPGTPYLAGFRSISNLAGASSGEIAAVVVWEPPKDSAEVVADSAAADGAAADTASTDGTPADTASADGTTADSASAEGPPAPDSAAAPPPDTVGIPPDTVGVPTATVGVPTDTVGVPTDTVGVPTDTVGVPPDTPKVPPDRAEPLPGTLASVTIPAKVPNPAPKAAFGPHPTSTSDPRPARDANTFRR